VGEVITKCLCGNDIPESKNYCSWECRVNEAKNSGCKEILPNNLPIKCITGYGLLLEHEHGDHPDYKFPVEVAYIGPVGEDQIADFELLTGRHASNEDEVRSFYTEVHALIYTDGSVALTLYECNYAIWSVETGECLGGRYVNKKENKLITLGLV
jgi:hypothetical protein